MLKMLVCNYPIRCNILFFFLVRGPMQAPWQAVSVKAVRCFSLCSLGVSFEANRAVCLLASNNLVLPFVSIEARSTRTAF